MLIERAQGATEPRLDWVSVRLYNYNRKCERSNKNETEKEEINSRVDISAHPSDSPLHLQRLRSMEQQQTSLQGENSTRMIHKNNFCKIAQRIYFKYFIWEFQCGGSLFGANYLSWSVITRNLDKVAFSYQSKSAEDKNIISLVIAIISRHLLSKHVFTKSALFSKIIILPSYNHPSWCLWPQCVPSCSCTHTTVRCDSLTDIQSFTSPHYNIQHL